MSNILEVPQQQAIQALFVKGWSVRHIARTLGINRTTLYNKLRAYGLETLP